jgi:hypothetical protein
MDRTSSKQKHVSRGDMQAAGSGLLGNRHIFLLFHPLSLLFHWPGTDPREDLGMSTSDR